MRRHGFTLIEMLVVVGIIVLMVALAVPVLGVLKGNRSIEGAQNYVGAMLAMARAEAMETQRTRGVLFYVDPRTGRDALVLVEAARPGEDPVHLDLVPDRDPVLLPQGIAAMVINGDINERYYEPRRLDSNRTVSVGGVILFDRMGHIISLPFAFQAATNDGWTGLGRLLYNSDGSGTAPAPVLSPGTVRSQFGLVLVDRELFQNAAGSNPDGWIDNNAVPLLVNRFNGTLIRGE